MASHSQISFFQLMRLFLAMIIYMFLSLGSAIPLLFVDESKWTPPDNFLASPALKSPWTNPKLCYPDNNTDDRFLYYYRARCPGPLSYYPAFVGVGIFLMYGFGSPVRAAFRKMANFGRKLFRAPRSKRASRPLDSYSESECEIESPISLSIEGDEAESPMERRPRKTRSKQL